MKINVWMEGRLCPSDEIMVIKERERLRIFMRMGKSKDRVLTIWNEKRISIKNI